MLDLNAAVGALREPLSEGRRVVDAVGEEDVQETFPLRAGRLPLREDPRGAGIWSVRAFANERRFFVFDWTTPLVDDDDSNAANGENGGVRVDAEFKKLGITALYSVLAGDFDDAPGPFVLEGSVHSSPRVVLRVLSSRRPRGERCFGTTRSSRRSSPARTRVCSPSSRTRSPGTTTRRCFSPAARSIGARTTGRTSARSSRPAAPRSPRSVSPRFPRRSGDRSISSGGTTRCGRSSRAISAGWDLRASGRSLGAYFTAREVSLNANALFHTNTRSAVENEETDWFDAGVWAALKNGMECFVRGGAGENRRRPGPARRGELCPRGRSAPRRRG